MIGDYTNPMLKPEAAEVVKNHGEITLTASYPTPTNQCWPGGVPFRLVQTPPVPRQENGHELINTGDVLWRPSVEAFLQKLKL